MSIIGNLITFGNYFYIYIFRKERPNTGDSRKFTKIDYSETEHVKKRAPKQKQLAVVVVSPLPAQKHPIENKI